MKNIVEEELTEMSADEKNEFVRMSEQETLEALFDLGNYRENPEVYTKISLKRPNRNFEFHIRPISEDENTQCRKNNTRFKKDKRTGVMYELSRDDSRYRSELIYTATADEDKYIWENKKAWDKFSVASAPDLISAVLMNGEKMQIISVISEISGFTDDVAGKEETAKN